MCFETVYLCAICSMFQSEGHYLSHHRRFCNLGPLNSNICLVLFKKKKKKNHIATCPSQALACSVCHPDYGPSRKSVSLFRPPTEHRGGFVSYVLPRNAPECQRITKRVKITHESAHFHILQALHLAQYAFF